LINEDWSPKQISGYLSLKSEHISHETIYKRIRRHTPHDRKRPLRMKTNLNLSGNTYPKVPILEMCPSILLRRYNTKSTEDQGKK